MVILYEHYPNNPISFWSSEVDGSCIKQAVDHGGLPEETGEQEALPDGGGTQRLFLILHSFLHSDLHVHLMFLV